MATFRSLADLAAAIEAAKEADRAERLAALLRREKDDQALDQAGKGRPEANASASSSVAE